MTVSEPDPESRARYHELHASYWRRLGREDLARQRDLLAASWRAGRGIA